MSAGMPADQAGAGSEVGGGDRRSSAPGGPEDEVRRAPSHAPDTEPGPAEMPGDRQPIVQAPGGEAPDMSEINPGDGPGQSPGE